VKASSSTASVNVFSAHVKYSCRVTPAVMTASVTAGSVTAACVMPADDCVVVQTVACTYNE
jgi:hypothetical protein